jgi:hypothetical protein
MVRISRIENRTKEGHPYFFFFFGFILLILTILLFFLLCLYAKYRKWHDSAQG